MKGILSYYGVTLLKDTSSVIIVSENLGDWRKLYFLKDDGELDSIWKVHIYDPSFPQNLNADGVVLFKFPNGIWVKWNDGIETCLLMKG